jgi:UDP-2,3-diacylglucosamine hydrolase
MKRKKEMPLSTELGLQRIHRDSWTCVDFISDLHLSEHAPKTFESFKAYLEQTPAQALFILGDLLEVWIGDDCLDQDPFNFERTCVSLIEKASERIKIFFMPGNRDFLVGSSFLTQSGMNAISDPCVLECQNERLLLSHGDALCLSDEDYQKFRQEVRSERWQTQFLSKPLSVRLDAAVQMRAQSQKRQAALKPTEQAELDAEACLSWLFTHQCNLLIHGHTHRPMRHQLDVHHAREVLSDWDGHAMPPRAEVLRLQNSQLSRLELAR